MTLREIPPLDEDTRYAMRHAAQAVERRNRPRWMVIASAFILVFSLLFAWLSWSAKSSAEDTLAYEAGEAREILRVAEQLDEMKSILERKGERGNAAADRFSLSRIEQLGTQAGLERFPAPPDPQPELIEGAVRWDYRYTIRDKSAQDLISWLRLVHNAGLGVHIRSLRLEHRNTDWELVVTLSRWEARS